MQARSPSQARNRASSCRCMARRRVVRAIAARQGHDSPVDDLAEAGEFTRRAFVNGKLDLTEVEGLGDLYTRGRDGDPSGSGAWCPGERRWWPVSRRLDGWREAPAGCAVPRSKRGWISRTRATWARAYSRELDNAPGGPVAEPSCGRGEVRRPRAHRPARACVCAGGRPTPASPASLNALAKSTIGYRQRRGRDDPR